MSEEIKKSVNICLNVIIPSLFGFMALSSFLIRTGIYKLIFKPVYFFFRHIIRFSEKEFSVLLLSLIGGYPVGVKLIADICGEDGNSTVKEILPFCYCGSPVFLISIVGIGIYGSAETGIFVYLSNMLACVILAAFYGFIRKKKPIIIALDKANYSIKVTKDDFIGSVLSASHSLFPVCAMILVFGIIIRVFGYLDINGIIYYFTAGIDQTTADAFFNGFLEISRISGAASRDILLLPFIAALCSFGGCCIILQVAALAGKKLKLGRFLIYRVPAAFLSGIICFLLTQNVNPYIETGTRAPVPVVTETGNPVSSLVLLIMSVFVIALAYRKEKISLSITDK